jgi:hypothetical protein
MPKRTIKRLPEVKNLYEILPKGTEGGKEFARVVDLLLFQEARREGRRLSLFDDSAGDYYGLDSFEGDIFRKEGTTGYQYKFYPSPLSAKHRNAIIDSLKKAADRQKALKLKKWILVTPQDFVESATRKNGGDVTWFEELRSTLKLKFELEHWGHKKLLSFFLQTPSLCLFYYPEVTANADSKKTIEDTRRRYDDNLTTLYRNIEFVGMSVYKQEATKGVPMEHIYIPLTVVPETADERDSTATRVNPLKFLEPGSRRVVLGDPGSGKSTLLRFLTLVGMSRALQRRCHAKPDKRLPIFITLRRYADELKNRRQLSLIDYIQECIQGDFNLKSADQDFFEYYLETGQAILLFDGVDELPTPHFKQTIRDRIRTLVTTYPGNTVLVTSRIVGYESNLRFSDKEFSHFRLTKLQLSEMEKFVTDWYQARIENVQEREANAQDLIRILQNEGNTAIRELAENPLLLTIVALVHRIDAVLPDERVVLYQKCTETLLNTWHTWKYRDPEVKNKGREERRNRRRMEAIANWMHSQSTGVGKDQRAVVPQLDLLRFLTDHITKQERPYDPNNDPEDVASEFLEFVRKKAGLLIEVGDERYSFVHQTFQEYLTASYIIKSNESNGVDGIWSTIRPHCNDARWLEVIRLLIADLQSTASQHTIIERLLSLKGTNASSKPLLLTGLLIDGVEPAELHRREIIEQVILSASNSSEDSDFRSLLGMLRTWLSKDTADDQIAKTSLESLVRATKTKEHQLRLVLTAAALGWPEFISRMHKTSQVSSKTAETLRFLLLESEKRVQFEQFDKEFGALWSLQDVFSFTSAYTNFVAAMCSSVTSSASREVVAKRRFEEQLVLLSAGFRGPFADYNLNTVSIGPSDLLNEAESVGEVSVESSVRKADPKLGAFINSLASLRKTVREAPMTAARERAMSFIKDEKLAKSVFQMLDPGRDRHLLRLTQDDRIWEKVLASPKLSSHILDVILLAFNLNSLPQWREALRVLFLPTIPKRLGDPLNQEECRKLQLRLRGKKPSQITIYETARLLLFDCWLFAMKIHDYRKQSTLSGLARLARGMDAPPLRIALCIRDLFLGDSSRKKELISMVESKEPAYRKIFETCYWREDGPPKSTSLAAKRVSSRAKKR